MRESPKAIWGAILMCTLVLAGCGSTTASTGKVVPQIPFKSAAISGTSIPTLYTCDGKNIAPPLEWGSVPASTRQLALFVLGIHPVPGTTKFTISVEWTVVGLSPLLHSLTPGHLPHGAYTGLASNGSGRYSLCPAKGTTAQYQFELYALPADVAIPRKFVGEQLLGALDTANKASPTIAQGIFDAAYSRK
jgi:phosphatidylethanolamine-binding protein (PEBP) family uncharacterized protein